MSSSPRSTLTAEDDLEMPDTFHEDDDVSCTSSSVSSVSDCDPLEPRLKYERLSAELRPRLLLEDAISAIAVHPRIIVIGTYFGRTYTLDANGNHIGGKEEEAQASASPPADLKSVMVTSVSIDHTGEFIASSTLDGQVAIKGLVSKEHNYSFRANKAIKAISIDPIFSRSGAGRRFMTGDDSLIYHEKSIFNRYKQTPLCENEGPISVIKWRGRFAAWASEKGIRVYDIVNEMLISIVKFEEAEANEDVPVRISWLDQHKFIVSKGDEIKACEIKPRQNQNGTLPQFMVEVCYSFCLLNMWVCGVAPFEKGKLSPLVVLTVPKRKSGEDHYRRPQLLVVQQGPEDGPGYTELATDLLSVKGYDKFRPKDYHLEVLLDDQYFFVVSPKDIVLGKPRDIDDHLDWLIDHEKYGQALDDAEKNIKASRRHDVLTIGRMYLDYLLEDAQFDAAGNLCARLFRNNKHLWQEEVFKFARLNQLKILAPFIPRGRDLKLDPQVYEMTLFELLKTDSEGFLNVIKLWPPSLYHVSAIVKPLVEQLLTLPDDECLQRALATLFSYQGKYDKAMAILLKLGHEDVFELIRTHSLFEAILDKIPDLMELNAKDSIKLFIENVDKISPELIVGKLGNEKKFLYLYLDSLVSTNYEESKKFHGELVLLYADFAQPKLMPFLLKSDSYPIQEALEICRDRYYIEEQIFILARMGNTKEALNLITENLVDIHRAVEFCKEHDDPDLWIDLIERSLDKPYFINVLLHNIGTHVDPRLLIQKIEPGQEIPGLRDSVVQIIQDYKLQVSLQQGCQRILISDCFSLLQKEIRLRDKGLAVHSDATCRICGAKVVNERSAGHDWMVFQCRHAFHVECLGDRLVCRLCNKHV